VAFIIDSIILNFIAYFIILIIESAVARFLIGILVGMVCDVGFWVANNGQTPGKMAMGVRVTMANGEPIDVGPALLRYVGYIVCALTLGIGYLMIALIRRSAVCTTTSRAPSSSRPVKRAGLNEPERSPSPSRSVLLIAM